MLSRTASSLVWMSRQIERADGLARLIDMTTRLDGLPAPHQGDRFFGWEHALSAAAARDAFFAAHDEADPETVVRFLAFSADNPSSILRCLDMARQNARAVRSALTSEMWDAINGAWLELKNLKPMPVGSAGLARFLEWVRELAMRIDGFGFRTMLRNDAFHFARLGILLERSDNIARLLAEEEPFLLKRDSQAAAGIGVYPQCAALLQAASAVASYHWVYRQDVKPHLVADLLLFNQQQPRSLASCQIDIAYHLDRLALAYGQHGPSQRQAHAICSTLTGRRLDSLSETDLQTFLRELIRQNQALADTIARQYLS
jgi:uncharacterized alpha-E superfamily protein